MPTIEITQHQANALARGRNITVAPVRPKPAPSVLIIDEAKRVWEVRGFKRDAWGTGAHRGTDFRLLRSPARDFLVRHYTEGVWVGKSGAWDNCQVIELG